MDQMPETHDAQLDAVHPVLTRTTRIGQYRSNTRDHRTKTPKPGREHAVMEVAAIIPEAQFEAVLAFAQGAPSEVVAPMAMCRDHLRPALVGLVLDENDPNDPRTRRDSGCRSIPSQDR